MESRPADAVNLERVVVLARALADSDPGPAAELACALADVVVALAGRVDALWQLIGAALEAAGLSGEQPGAPPTEFVQALTSPGSSDQGVRLNIGGREWVAAISQEEPPADPASAWAALERIARAADDQDRT